jgi:hypothetical protein
MKKNLFILSFLCLCGLMFVSCGDDKKGPDTPVTPEEPVATAACYTLTVELDFMEMFTDGATEVFWGTEEEANQRLEVLKKEQLERKQAEGEEGWELINSSVEKNDKSESDCVNVEE